MFTLHKFTIRLLGVDVKINNDSDKVRQTEMIDIMM
jgi:hypothetical protein